MDKTKVNTSHKIGKFIKKNLYYIILISTIVSVLTVFMVQYNKKINETIILNDNIQVVQDGALVEDVSTSQKISFQVPVASVHVIRDYSDEEFVNYASLGYYATHMAIDFSGEISTKVLSVADGKVLSVYTNNNEGTVVKVQHENGFVSVYASLDNSVNVVEGQQLKKGAQIGVMSNSMQDEAELGVHLHFSLLKDNVVIDPNLYMSISNK